MEQPKLRAWARQQFPRLGMSQRQFADEFGISKATLHAILRDDEQWLGLAPCQALSKAFNTPLKTVLELAEILPPPPPGSAETLYLAHVYGQLDAAQQKQLVKFAEFLSASPRNIL